MVHCPRECYALDTDEINSEQAAQTVPLPLCGFDADWVCQSK